LVAVTINGVTAQAADGSSLFDCADGIGIPVPTSCRKQGKCKECIVEVTQGIESLSERTEQERHLNGSFRLSCQARVNDAPASGRWQAEARPTRAVARNTRPRHVPLVAAIIERRCRL
jgi:ferredoxin